MNPHSVMLGFVNGLAIVIGMAQIGSFKTLGENGTLEFLQGTQLGLMAGLVLLTMAIIFFLPKLTRTVPSSLAAIVVVTLISIGLNAGGEGNRGRALRHPRLLPEKCRPRVSKK